MNVKWKYILRIAQLLWGPTPARLGSISAIAGIGVLTNIPQHLIEAIFRVAFEIELGIPESSQRVGWILLVIGILMSVYGARQQIASQKLATPNPHDIKNLQKLRSLLHPDLQFFREHDFNSSFDRKKTDLLDHLTYEWKGAHCDFVDPSVQEKLVILLARANELASAIAVNTFCVETNPSWATTHPGTNIINADERALEVL